MAVFESLPRSFNQCIVLLLNIKNSFSMLKSSSECDERSMGMCALNPASKEKNTILKQVIGKITSYNLFAILRLIDMFLYGP